MAVQPGSRLGPYEVTALIGEGGMGQVFRARDTKLSREVALKVLPDSFAHDADRLERFTREARTLAALNHPHIAQLYGVETSRLVAPNLSGDQSGASAPSYALVMELVDGEDLARRIARAPLTVEEAVAVARQIAAALEALESAQPRSAPASVCRP